MRPVRFNGNSNLKGPYSQLFFFSKVQLWNSCNVLRTAYAHCKNKTLGEIITKVPNLVLAVQYPYPVKALKPNLGAFLTYDSCTPYHLSQLPLFQHDTAATTMMPL